MKINKEDAAADDGAATATAKCLYMFIIGIQITIICSISLWL